VAPEQGCRSSRLRSQHQRACWWPGGGEAATRLQAHTSSPKSSRGHARPRAWHRNASQDRDRAALSPAGPRLGSCRARRRRPPRRRPAACRRDRRPRAQRPRPRSAGGRAAAAGTGARPPPPRSAGPAAGRPGTCAAARAADDPERRPQSIPCPAAPRSTTSCAARRQLGAAHADAAAAARSHARAPFPAAAAHPLRAGGCARRAARQAASRRGRGAGPACSQAGARQAGARRVMKSRASADTAGLAGKATTRAFRITSSRRMASWLRPSPNGRRPNSIWYTTTPAAHTSTYAAPDTPRRTQAGLRQASDRARSRCLCKGACTRSHTRLSHPAARGYMPSQRRMARSATAWTEVRGRGESADVQGPRMCTPHAPSRHPTRQTLGRRPRSLRAPPWQPRSMRAPPWPPRGAAGRTRVPRAGRRGRLAGDERQQTP